LADIGKLVAQRIDFHEKLISKGGKGGILAGVGPVFIRQRQNDCDCIAANLAGTSPAFRPIALSGDLGARDGAEELQGWIHACPGKGNRPEGRTLIKNQAHHLRQYNRAQSTNS
jgi:hypothetical protein